MTLTHTRHQFFAIRRRAGRRSGLAKLDAAPGLLRPAQAAPRGDTLGGGLSARRRPTRSTSWCRMARPPTTGPAGPRWASQGRMTPQAKASLRAIDLDGFFGLHPSLAPLLPAWQAGHLAPVHGLRRTRRSRAATFHAMELMEGAGWMMSAARLPAGLAGNLGHA